LRLLFASGISPWDRRAGGGQWVCYELARHCAALGHEVDLVCLGTRPEEIPDLPFGTHWVPEGSRFLSTALRLHIWFRRWREERRPDALYTTVPEAIGLAASQRRVFALIMNSQHYDPPLLESPPWTHPLRRVSHYRRMQRFYAERSLLRSADRVIAATQFGRRALLERGYLDEDSRLVVIPNGVSSHWFQETRQTPTKGETTFLFVGRLEPQKGVDLLLRAFCELPKHCKLRIVGTGPHEGEYKGLAQDLGLSLRVEFVGHSPPAAVRRELERAYALVLPSRAELFGIVLVEAMAMGVPVIASRVGGIPEVVVHEGTGLLVPRDDVHALAAAMRRMQSDQTLRSQFARQGPDHAARFRWDRLVERTLAEIEGAVVGRTDQ
jgi:glycosyltransferase involved in cell wall biosynthesis